MGPAHPISSHSPTAEWSVQPNLVAPDAEQVQDKYGISNNRIQDKFQTDNPNIRSLERMLGEKELTVKEMMESLELKGRDNLLKLYLTPAINYGYISLLYPQSPHHPRQKYLLTAKGMMLLESL